MRGGASRLCLDTYSWVLLFALLNPHRPRSRPIDSGGPCEGTTLLVWSGRARHIKALLVLPPFGFDLDSAEEFVEVAAGSFLPSGRRVSGTSREYDRPVCERLYVLLDLPTVPKNFVAALGLQEHCDWYRDGGQLQASIGVSGSSDQFLGAGHVHTPEINSINRRGTHHRGGRGPLLGHSRLRYFVETGGGGSIQRARVLCPVEFSWPIIPGWTV